MGWVKSYARVVSTADGGSAFEEAELQLDGVQHSPDGDGEPGMLVAALGATGDLAFVRFGAFTEEFHQAAAPQWVIMLRGVIEVQVSDGTARRFGAGDILLATDTTGCGHATLMTGEGPHEALGIAYVPAG
jgi:hypothetical protein